MCCSRYGLVSSASRFGIATFLSSRGPLPYHGARSRGSGPLYPRRGAAQPSSAPPAARRPPRPRPCRGGDPAVRAWPVATPETSTRQLRGSPSSASPGAFRSRSGGGSGGGPRDRPQRISGKAYRYVPTSRRMPPTLTEPRGSGRHACRAQVVYDPEVPTVHHPLDRAPDHRRPSAAVLTVPLPVDQPHRPTRPRPLPGTLPPASARC